MKQMTHEVKAWKERAWAIIQIRESDQHWIDERNRRFPKQPNSNIKPTRSINHKARMMILLDTIKPLVTK